MNPGSCPGFFYEVQSILQGKSFYYHWVRAMIKAVFY